MQAMKTRMRLFKVMMIKLDEVGGMGDICSYFLLKTPSTYVVTLDVHNTP